jgi:hypothetical protein
MNRGCDFVMSSGRFGGRWYHCQNKASRFFLGIVTNRALPLRKFIWPSESETGVIYSCADHALCRPFNTKYSSNGYLFGISEEEVQVYEVMSL